MAVQAQQQVMQEMVQAQIVTAHLLMDLQLKILKRVLVHRHMFI